MHWQRGSAPAPFGCSTVAGTVGHLVAAPWARNPSVRACTANCAPSAAKRSGPEVCCRAASGERSHLPSQAAVSQGIEVVRACPIPTFLVTCFAVCFEPFPLRQSTISRARSHVRAHITHTLLGSSYTAATVPSLTFARKERASHGNLPGLHMHRWAPLLQSLAV